MAPLTVVKVVLQSSTATMNDVIIVSLYCPLLFVGVLANEPRIALLFMRCVCCVKEAKLLSRCTHGSEELPADPIIYGNCKAGLTICYCASGLHHSATLLVLGLEHEVC